MPTQLEGAMDTMIRIFHHYSGKEGDKYKLNKGELKQLLQSELTDFLAQSYMCSVGADIPDFSRPLSTKATLRGLSKIVCKWDECQKDPQLVDKIMKDLDSNKDNEVDFNEFVVLVAALTVACNDFFEEQLRKKGK